MDFRYNPDGEAKILASTKEILIKLADFLDWYSDSPLYNDLLEDIKQTPILKDYLSLETMGTSNMSISHNLVKAIKSDHTVHLLNDKGKLTITDNTVTIPLQICQSEKETRSSIIVSMNDNLEEHNDHSDSVIKSMNEINKYLKQRAKDTSGLWVTLTCRYTGDDYYSRRDSWQRILNKLKMGNFNEVISAIDAEAIDFKRSPFDLFELRRCNYHSYLMEFKQHFMKCCDKDTTNIQDKAKLYSDAYEKMSSYKEATRSWINDHSLFSENVLITTQVQNESVSYTAAYDNLPSSDKSDFLTPAEEHDSEYENLQRHW